MEEKSEPALWLGLFPSLAAALSALQENRLYVTGTKTTSEQLDESNAFLTYMHIEQTRIQTPEPNDQASLHLVGLRHEQTSQHPQICPVGRVR